MLVDNAKRDYDFESRIALGLYNHSLDLDSTDAGFTTYDRELIQFTVEQQLGHATLIANVLGSATQIDAATTTLSSPLGHHAPAVRVHSGPAAYDLPAVQRRPLLHTRLVRRGHPAIVVPVPVGWLHTSPRALKGQMRLVWAELPGALDVYLLIDDILKCASGLSADENKT
ncbi:hypothetical protein PAAG_11740 [Paracoccidioides lutzii Pb01]|uniref:Uncharacterized protein n=1 Tax=Paracoccidioides lutzii (strain ATCC MYA-826 / Pb01) TaxID=502779 RepID=A0A0A2V5T2_PARBA|nr:hypothetical protein PAAG_11740 [Paracoccidioides lutzii Pb01]KGQ01505.1 hypothetical protein PAAG_11740 [Paracoccidioides lutzii Pb01]